MANGNCYHLFCKKYREIYGNDPVFKMTNLGIRRTGNYLFTKRNTLKVKYLLYKFKKSY